MTIGISTPLPAYKVNAAFMASKAELLGFESIWYAEHPVLPVNTTSRFPGSEDGVIPWTYSHFADPFIALGSTEEILRRLNSLKDFCEKEKIELVNLSTADWTILPFKKEIYENF